MVSELLYIPSWELSPGRVLILVLMEDGLGVLAQNPKVMDVVYVLILVLMEDGLGEGSCFHW